MQVSLPSVSEVYYGKLDGGTRAVGRAKVRESVDAWRLRKVCSGEMNGNGSGGDELVISSKSSMDHHRHLSESRDVRMNDVAMTRDRELPALDPSGTDTSEKDATRHWRLGHLHFLRC
jgi:hypothetical protein